MKSCVRSNFKKKRLEAREGIEPSIKVLQTFALPLGDRAILKKATCEGCPLGFIN